MSHVRFRRFSQVHLLRFLPGVLGIAVTRSSSRRIRFGVDATLERVRLAFWFVDVTGSRLTSSWELSIRRGAAGGRRRDVLFGRANGKTGDVDWIRWVDDGGVVGDVWEIGGIARLFFLRAIGGRGGFEPDDDSVIIVVGGGA